MTNILFLVIKGIRIRAEKKFLPLVDHGGDVPTFKLLMTEEKNRSKVAPYRAIYRSFQCSLGCLIITALILIVFFAVTGDEIKL
jgi:hypothetical protein